MFESHGRGASKNIVWPRPRYSGLKNFLCLLVLWALTVRAGRTTINYYMKCIDKDAACRACSIERMATAESHLTKRAPATTFEQRRDNRRRTLPLQA